MLRNNNTYSNIHNVWTYTFNTKKYDEEYRTQEGDPSQLDTQYVKLSYFDHPNLNSPTIIVSRQLTAFLKSLTDTEYETVIKPLFIQATTRVPHMCLNDESCAENYIENISSEDFIIAVKGILAEITSIIPKSIYLDILLQKQKYLWYKMYWSLDTTIDNPPIITYDSFNPVYRMCFCGVPFETVLKASNIMKDMLNEGYNETATQYLDSLAKPWLECVDQEYERSISILQENGTAWTNAFLYNLTTYIKATTMMEYILLNIQHIDYELTTPHKIKRILHYGKEEWLFKPMIYSLYLPTFLNPYIKYVKMILSDREKIITDPNLANLTLDTTAFGETMPLNNTTDRTVTDFMTYQHYKTIRINDNMDAHKNDSNKFVKFVKFVTKAAIKGYIILHYPIFGIMYQAYSFSSSVYQMLFEEDEIELMKTVRNTLKKDKTSNIPLSLISPDEEIPTSEFPPWQMHCQNPPNKEKQSIYRHGFMRNDINYLRRIAPKAKITENLLKKLKTSLSNKPLKTDIDLLNRECKAFVGSLHINSDSPIADYLAKIIKLHTVLRHLRPCDFYEEDQSIVVFAKTNYGLWCLRHFIYFQTYMLLYLQSIISVLINPDFKYTPISTDLVQAKVQISTLTYELIFNEKEITSLIINLRTMWSGKKILPEYIGESGILYNTYQSSILTKSLNKHELQSLYWRYREKKHINTVRDSTEKLYAALEDNSYFKLYTFLQDPVIFAKIVTDLLIRIAPIS